jgi:thiol-disulfide isomerase/thioredoxin
MTLVRKISRAAMLLLCAVGISLQTAAASLNLGDAAPPLKVGKWVKGEPVKKFEPGKVYVVEFWATWCGPCRESIPHVSQLQKQYDANVTFIGQNILEQDDSAVPAFVKEMGDKMNYRVALDDKTAEPNGAMAKTWMEAAGQNGIPCAFIINQETKIAWIGHPMEMEEPLEQIVAGKYDVAKAAAEAKFAAEHAGEVQGLFQKYTEAVKAKDADAALKAIDQVSALVPKYAGRAPAMKFQTLLKMGDTDKAYPMADAAFESIKNNDGALNDIAWTISAGEGIKTRDLKIARKFAERSVELTKHEDPAILDTLARIYFDQGEAKKAVDTEAEAVAKADEKLKTELSATLEKYKAAAAKKGTGAN